MNEPLHTATVKSYSKKKGFGVVTLNDGIAILHADSLRAAINGIEDIEANVVMHVTLKQAAGGRMVSEIKRFEKPTVRFDHDKKKAFFKHPTPPPQQSEGLWGQPSEYARQHGRLATVKWYSKAKGFGVVTLDDGIAILPTTVLEKTGCGGIYPNVRMYVKLAPELRDRIISEILAFCNDPTKKDEGLTDIEQWLAKAVEAEKQALQEAEERGEFEWAFRML